jgi:hypothetical protein
MVQCIDPVLSSEARSGILRQLPDPVGIDEPPVVCCQASCFPAESGAVS